MYPFLGFLLGSSCLLYIGSPLGFGLGSNWLLYIGVPLIIGIWAQIRVSSAFSHWSKVRANGNITGAECAREILQAAQIQDVEVMETEGKLKTRLPGSLMERLKSIELTSMDSEMQQRAKALREKLR